MTAWHLAQVNVGRTVADVDDSIMAGFMNNLDRINALAERTPGFVWRLQGESGNATDIAVTDDPRVIVNLSVWETVESLFDFAYRSEHKKFVARRREWFERWEGPYMALWWVPAGHRPTVAEAMKRLAILAKNGPGPRAFTFKSHFPDPDLEMCEAK